MFNYHALTSTPFLRTFVRTYASVFMHRAAPPRSGPAASSKIMKGKGYKGRNHPHLPGPDIRRVRISKNIRHFLQHNELFGLPVQRDGFVKVSDLLQQPSLSPVTLPIIQDIVKLDNAQRFQLVYEGNGSWLIRLTPYHYKGSRKDSFRLLTQKDNITTVVYPTGLQVWMNTIRSHGISTSQLPYTRLFRRIPPMILRTASESASHSSMPSRRQNRPTTRSSSAQTIVSSRVLIYINVPAAMESGIKFYIAKNGDLFTAGNDFQLIPPLFFEKVFLDEVKSDSWDVNPLEAKVVQPASEKDSLDDLSVYHPSLRPVVSRHGREIDTRIIQRAPQRRAIPRSQLRSYALPAGRSSRQSVPTDITKESGIDKTATCTQANPARTSQYRPEELKIL